MAEFLDPLKFAAEFWPDVTFYRQQQEIIYSVVDNDETYVPAGNELGKDFVAAFVALWWFVSRKPARVVTTSVAEYQLEDVLWGEIRRFVQSAKARLPIQYNHLKIRLLNDDGSLHPNAELVGRVAKKQEGLLGRHATAGFKPVADDLPRTLVIFDEASGIDDEVFTSTQTWAHRKLVIGNPFPCQNFFRRGVKAGDLPRPGGGYYRKVIRIKAVDSPNVQLALAEEAAGKKPSGEVCVPGVKDYRTYLQNRQLWDPVLQCIGLDAQFYEGAENLMYPPAWLEAARRRAADLSGRRRRAVAMGVDPGEGSAFTVWVLADEYGVVARHRERTANTAVIPGRTISLIKDHDLDPSRVLFDRGGGGREHADRLRALGYDVESVGFGEAPYLPLRRRQPLSARQGNQERHYAFKNLRAQMYWQLRQKLDPSLNPDGFAIPGDWPEVFEQLGPVPVWYDGEERLFLPPKRAKSGGKGDEVTMAKLVGCSPDDSDALVLAVHSLVHGRIRASVGVL